MLFCRNRSLTSRLGRGNCRAYSGQTETYKQNESRRSNLHVVALLPQGRPRGRNLWVGDKIARVWPPSERNDIPTAPATSQPRPGNEKQRGTEAPRLTALFLPFAVYNRHVQPLKPGRGEPGWNRSPSPAEAG